MKIKLAENIPMSVRMTGRHTMFIFLLLSISLLLVSIVLTSPPSAHAQSGDMEVKNSDYTFVDSNGMTNIVGVVNNRGLTPVSVVMAIDVSDSSGSITMLQEEEPYSRLLFPETGAPFKFRIAPDVDVVSEPYVASVEYFEQQPFFNSLVFEYSNMAVGEEKALFGTVRNTGPFPFYNVTVYASVHDREMVQIDSSRSDAIPVIEPGQVAEFVILPDEAIRDQVMYYSCAGFDPNAPIPTIPAGDGKYIAYNMQTVSKISHLRYDNSTDSMTFRATPYNPAGTNLALKLAQMEENQTVTVMLNGEINDGASVTMDGRTISVDMFIPPGEQQVQIQGVRAIPEFPIAALGLAGTTAAVIAMARLKAAFKVR